MDLKKILIAVLALLVGLVLGFAIGQPMGQQAGHEIGQQLARQEAEIEIRRLTEVAEELWSIGPERFMLNGLVFEVGHNSLIIEAFQFSPLEDPPVLRDILVDESTIIVKRKEKDSEVYKKEMEEYARLEEELIAQIEAGIELEDLPELPELYAETEITLDDIEPGFEIWVLTDRDIKWLESFTAVKIAVAF